VKTRSNRNEAEKVRDRENGKMAWKGHVETDAEAGAADDELEPWESNEERETLDETRIANRGTNLAHSFGSACAKVALD